MVLDFSIQDAFDIPSGHPPLLVLVQLLVSPEVAVQVLVELPLPLLSLMVFQLLPEVEHT